MKPFIRIILTFLCAGLIQAGCLAYVPPPPPDGYYAPGPPPAAMVEVRPAVPYPEAAWVDGYWNYYGGQWAWRNGYWDRRPHAGARWESGYWHHYGSRGWGYHPGHWR